MTPRVIAMLTNNDMTVPGALKVFEENKHARTPYWGFKDTNIGKKDMIELHKAMKDAGKTTFFEPLGLEEQQCIDAANFAIEQGFDYLLSMTHYPSSTNILKNSPVKAMPTCGRREGMPRKLCGTIEEIVNHARQIEKAGADGICLSIYRYTDGDPEALAEAFVKGIGIPFNISGAINSYERLDMVKRLKPWGFTIGSALFNGDFGKDKTLAEQLDIIQNYLES